MSPNSQLTAARSEGSMCSTAKPACSRSRLTARSKSAWRSASLIFDHGARCASSERSRCVWSLCFFGHYVSSNLCYQKDMSCKIGLENVQRTTKADGTSTSALKSSKLTESEGNSSSACATYHTRQRVYSSQWLGLYQRVWQQPVARLASDAIFNPHRTADLRDVYNKSVFQRNQADSHGSLIDRPVATHLGRRRTRCEECTLDLACVKRATAVGVDAVEQLKPQKRGHEGLTMVPPVHMSTAKTGFSRCLT